MVESFVSDSVLASSCSFFTWTITEENYDDEEDNDDDDALMKMYDIY